VKIGCSGYQSVPHRDKPGGGYRYLPAGRLHTAELLPFR